jgi:hypothetical protein
LFAVLQGCGAEFRNAQSYMKKLFPFLLAKAWSASGAHATPLTTADVVKIAVPDVKKIFGDDREDTFINVLAHADCSFLGFHRHCDLHRTV